MKTARIILPCLALALAFPAVAQEFSGAITLGYSSGTTESNYYEADTTSPSIAGRIDVDLGNNWSIGIAADRTGYSYDSEREMTGSYYEINAAYAFGNGAWAGLYHAGWNIAGVGSSIGYNQTTYGIEGGYTFGAFELAGFAGPGDDMNTYGASGKYLGENFVVGASLTTSKVYGYDYNTLGLAGVYSINDSISLFGGVSRFEVAGVGSSELEQTTYGVGASYTFAGAGVPMVASLEIGGAEIDNVEDWSSESIRVGLTVPFGKKTISAPQGSVADSVFNPRKVQNMLLVGVN